MEENNITVEVGMNKETYIRIIGEEIKNLLKVEISREAETNGWSVIKAEFMVLDKNLRIK